MIMTEHQLRWLWKPLALVLALVPLIWLAADAMGHRLGANPVEAISHRTGDWALRFLLLTLAVTPARRLSGWVLIQRFRRMLGLLSFTYASLHVATWVWLDRGLDWAAMAEDIAERPYVTLGMGAFGLMLPLALTSTRAMMRRLGRRWRTLHRAIYGIGVLAILHFIWLTKADYAEPLGYGLVLALLLLARLPWGQRAGAQR